MLPRVKTTQEIATTLGLDETLAAEIRRWGTEPRYAELHAEVQALLDRALAGERAATDELKDAFGAVLPIGTGGRRGACGVGPNRVSSVLVRETAQALVEVLRAEGAPLKVAVVYDTRKDSQRFAHAAARHLHACGVQVLLVDAPRATPVLSYLVRARGCGGGIVISASHNPPGDNGVKIYGRDGAQVLGARDAALTRAIERAATVPLEALDLGVPWSSLDGVEVIDASTIAAAVDVPYRDMVLATGTAGTSLRDAQLSVVFSPLHGVGHHGVVPVLEARGVTVHPVAAQLDPDGGRFSTVDSANPEDPRAFEAGLALARETGADLVLATDPDADRLGAMVRDRDGAYHFIDGNRLGVLMLDQILSSDVAFEGGQVLTTLVSSPLLATYGRAEGIEVVDDLLVGFKHHAGMAEESPERPVIFACEESHGYVRGDAVRDKDGSVAALLLCERAAACKRRGETLHENLRALWTRFGYHRERTTSIFARGLEGRAKIEGLMSCWREASPQAFGGLEVVAREDRMAPRATGSAVRDLPGNVLSFELRGADEACRLVLRPSGTEPKVKVYVLARGEAGRTGAAMDAQIEAVDALVTRVAEDAVRRAEAQMQA